MKRLNKYFIVFLFFSFVLVNKTTVINGSNKLPATKMKRYGLKKACIEYTISGKMQSGTETLYFDNWGAQEAKFNKTKIKITGFTQETNTVTYL